MLEMTLPSMEDWKEFELEAPTELSTDGAALLRNHIYYKYGNVAKSNVSRHFSGNYEFTSCMGTLVKRVKKVLYRSGVELDQESVDFIAKLIESERTSKRYVSYMVTPDLSWERGAWGDGASCFWTYNSRYRAGIVAAGGGAVIAEDKNTGRKGRMLLIPVEDSLYSFNARGFERPMFDLLIKDSLGGGVVQEPVPGFHFHTKMNVGEQRGFYHSGDAQRFRYAEIEPVAPSTEQDPPVLDGCYCVEVLNSRHAVRSEHRRCEHCPFKSKKDFGDFKEFAR